LIRNRIGKALGAAEVKQRFANIGVETAPMTAADFGQLTRGEAQM